MNRSSTRSPRSSQVFFNWLAVLVLIYLLIVAVGAISSGFRAAVGDEAEHLFAFAKNPFMGLIVGILATVLIQSSSTTIAIIVGLVAGGLSVTLAIPMVLGSNIGTTITCSIVSLGYVGDREKFKKAFSASTIQDLFNLLAVIIFFPLEMLFHLLERLSRATAGLLVGGADLSIDNLDFVGAITKPARDLIRNITGFLPEPFDGIVQILIGIGLIFASIKFIGKFLEQLMVGRARDMLHAALRRGPIIGILVGIIVTVLVQSSTTTSTLMVTLGGSGILVLEEIYPVTLGANIGTTLTALLAATAVTGPQALPALEIALVHVFYNLLAVSIIFSIPFLRPLPIIGARRLAAAGSENKFVIIAYLASVFFIIPSILLGLSLIF